MLSIHLRLREFLSFLSKERLYFFVYCSFFLCCLHLSMPWQPASRSRRKESLARYQFPWIISSTSIFAIKDLSHSTQKKMVSSQNRSRSKSRDRKRDDHVLFFPAHSQSSPPFVVLPASVGRHWIFSSAMRQSVACVMDAYLCRHGCQDTRYRFHMRASNRWEPPWLYRRFH